LKLVGVEEQVTEQSDRDDSSFHTTKHNTKWL